MGMHPTKALSTARLLQLRSICVLCEFFIIYSCVLSAIYFRNNNHAERRICRKEDNDDWLGCDRCSQFFHASCIGVDFAKAISEYFYC